MSLNGTFSPPGDKSISHRIALFSLLAEGTCKVANLSRGEDVRSSLRAVTLLGARVEYFDGHVILHGAGGRSLGRGYVDCGNSGTTIRLLMGILAGWDGRFTLDGDSSLRKRPMERVAEPLRRMGATVRCDGGGCPVVVEGAPLEGMNYTLPVPSAQLKSAVLLAGIQADGPTYVEETVPGRDHTERLIAHMEGRISRVSSNLWRVESSSLTLPEEFRVPSDISSAAFFLCAAAIVKGSRVTARGVLLNSTRTGFIGVLERMGAEVTVRIHGQTPEPWGSVEVRYSPDLAGCEIAAHEIPQLVDEVPILALVATQAAGTTVFNGVAELRLKESDRLAAITKELGLMGARIRTEGDCLIVEGPTRLTANGRLSSHRDHRMAMTLRLAGMLTDIEPEIDDEKCAAISYPGFHRTLEALAS